MSPSPNAPSAKRRGPLFFVTLWALIGVVLALVALWLVVVLAQNPIETRWSPTLAALVLAIFATTGIAALSAIVGGALRHWQSQRSGLLAAWLALLLNGLIVLWAMVTATPEGAIVERFAHDQAFDVPRELWTAGGRWPLGGSQFGLKLNLDAIGSMGDDRVSVIKGQEHIVWLYHLEPDARETEIGSDRAGYQRFEFDVTRLAPRRGYPGPKSEWPKYVDVASKSIYPKPLATGISNEAVLCRTRPVEQCVRAFRHGGLLLVYEPAQSVWDRDWTAIDRRMTDWLERHKVDPAAWRLSWFRMERVLGRALNKPDAT